MQMRHHKHKHARKDDDSMQESQAKEDEKAALNAGIAAKEQAERAAQQAAAAKAEWERKFNPFDGLVHEDDGRTMGLDGK